METAYAATQIKHYLWNQPLISRFNDEGKKTKSKGNHVWSVEARYIDVGHYEYRPPPPKIVPIPTTAAPGVPFSWTPKVLDSQCQGPPYVTKPASLLLDLSKASRADMYVLVLARSQVWTPSSRRRLYLLGFHGKTILSRERHPWTLCLCP